MTALADQRTFLGACRRSVNLFVEFIHDVHQGGLHKRLQAHWSAHDDCYAEYPRGHGKTTQLVARNCWELGHDQTLRIKVVQQTKAEARKSVALAKSILESDAYAKVFPEVEPDRECWGQMALKVKAKHFSRDPSIEAQGIGGRAGGRADILEADDICDLRNAIQQPTLREQVKDSWASNWLPFLDYTRRRRPRVWKVGTCYHVSDITADWRALHSEDGTLLRLPVVGEISPWPDGWGPEKLARQRRTMGPIAYARAYELLPVATELLIWPKEWLDDSLFLRMSPADERRSQWVVALDWAYTEARQKGEPDWSVALIGKITHTGHAYICDMVRVRATYPDFRRLVLGRCRHYGVVRGIAGSTAAEKALVDDFNEHARFPVKALDRVPDKITRAAEHQPFVETGRFHIQGERRGGVLVPTRALQQLYDEMTMFPAADWDDCADAGMDFMDLAVMGRPPVRPGRVPGGTSVGDMYAA